MHHIKYVPLAIALVAITLPGCGGGSQLGAVNGTVTVDGQPAPAGLKIEFDPVEKGVRGSTAVTKDGGHYEAVYSLSRNGVRTGPCVVKLVFPEVAPKPGKKPSLPYPEQYYEKIKQVEISSWSNTVDLELSKSAS